MLHDPNVWKPARQNSPTKSANDTYDGMQNAKVQNYWLKYINYSVF